MKKKQYVYLLLYLAILPLIVYGCTPKKSEDMKNPEGTSVAKEESVKIKKREEAETEIKEKTNNIQKTLKIEEIEEPEFKNSYTIGSQKYLSLLPQVPENSLLPEDFHIGKLYNKGDTSQDAVLIGSTISDFFTSMKNKTIKQSLLYQEKPSKEEESENSGYELDRLLTFHIENNNIPQTYRIGAITIENTDTAHAIVRVYGKKGVTNGEIYLIKEEKKWYISDMQINFYDLEIPEEDNGEKFLPTTYHWIFQGM